MVVQHGVTPKVALEFLRSRADHVFGFLDG